MAYVNADSSMEGEYRQSHRKRCGHGSGSSVVHKSGTNKEGKLIGLWFRIRCCCIRPLPLTHSSCEPQNANLRKLLYALFHLAGCLVDIW